MNKKDNYWKVVEDKVLKKWKIVFLKGWIALVVLLILLGVAGMAVGIWAAIWNTQSSAPWKPGIMILGWAIFLAAVISIIKLLVDIKQDKKLKIEEAQKSGKEVLLTKPKTK